MSCCKVHPDTEAVNVRPAESASTDVVEEFTHEDKEDSRPLIEEPPHRLEQDFRDWFYGASEKPVPESGESVSEYLDLKWDQIQVPRLLLHPSVTGSVTVVDGEEILLAELMCHLCGAADCWLCAVGPLVAGWDGCSHCVPC